MEDATDVMDFAESWLLPEAWTMVVRVGVLKNGKFKEKAFTNGDDGQKYIMKQMKKGNSVTAYTASQMAFSPYQADWEDYCD